MLTAAGLYAQGSNASEEIIIALDKALEAGACQQLLHLYAKANQQTTNEL